MTRQGWAEKLVGYAGKIDWAAKAAFTHVTDESLGLSPNAANARIAQLLRAEHRRAVRVVEQEIEAVKNDQRTYRSEEKCLILGSLETVLKGLQRGRE